MEASWSSIPLSLGLSADLPVSPLSNLPGTWTAPLLPAAIAPLPTRSSQATAIAFIDPTVADYHQLAAAIAPHTDVVVLNPLADAISQITQTLLRYSGLSSIHVISHGQAGQLQLGSTFLNAATLNQYAAQFQSWGEALTADADILLYGCDVGVGTGGNAFIQQLAQLTGADIAASTNLTGSAALGGDWVLEVNTGAIAASLILPSETLQQYQFVLPTQLVSVTGSTQGNGDSWAVNTSVGGWTSSALNTSRQTVSDDGRYVVFTTLATDLTGSDPNGAQEDIYLYDRTTNTTTLVSAQYNAGSGNNNTTTAANGRSFNPVMSGDGRYVAFTSTAANLVATDVNGSIQDVFLWDRVTRQTTLVSRGNGGAAGEGDAYGPSISRDGTRVSFVSFGNLLRNGNYNHQVFVYEWSTSATSGSIRQVSVNNAGQAGNGNSAINIPALLSGDGRYVVFQSAATNLAAGADPNGGDDIFVRDLVNNTTQLVSVNSTNTGAGNQGATTASISEDGRYVTFLSNATNLVSGANGARHAFVRDLVANTTEIVSVSSSETQANPWESTAYVTISGDGRFAVFTNASDNLVPNDTNGVRDVFVRNLTAGTTELISGTVGNLPGNGASAGQTDMMPAISFDGRYIVFTSAASNLVGNDTNGARDVFLRDRQLGTTTLISQNLAGTNSGNGVSDFGGMNRFGTAIVFSSGASNLVTTDTNGRFDVFVYSSANLPPIATNDSFGTSEDTLLTNNVVSNDSDSDNNVPLTVSLVSGTSNGSLSLNANGTFNYTPAANYSGTDTFTYSVRDSLGATSGLASVVLSVTATNDAPVAVNDAYTLATGAPFSPATGVLANDTDIDTPSANLTASVVNLPTSGNLVLNPNGTFSYTPNAGFTGSDRFVYQVNDGSANSGLATVSLSVTLAPNQAPVATNDSFGTSEDTLLTNNVVSNDSDSDNNVPLTVSLVSGTSNGSLSLNANGTFNYTPAANYSGTDTFTYSVRDSLGATSGLASVVLSVTATNDAPVAVNDAYTLATGAPFSPATGVLANDTDIDTPSANLTASVVNLPTSGNLVLNPNGTFSYTPNAGFTGSDRFVYQVNDGSANSGLATVSLNVTATVNTPPIAVNDTATGNEDTLLSGNVLGNDTDSDGNLPLTATLLTAPSLGSLSLNANGTFNYTPNLNFHGTDTFTYQNQDALGATSGPATVVLTVNPVNDAPSFTPGANLTVSAGAGAQAIAGWATGFVSGPATEAGQTIASYQLVSNSNPSLFVSGPSLDSSGTLTYTPVAAIGSTGSAVIGVQVQDSGGTANGGIDRSATQFFTITVTAQPTLSVGAVSQSEGNSGTNFFNFTVSLASVSSTTVGVQYTTADGTARATDSDYLATSGTLTFLPGETTKVVAVPVLGDTRLETNETFQLNLSAPTNAQLSTPSGTGTILNDDLPPTISVSPISLQEGNPGTRNFWFTVSLSNASDQAVSVLYGTTDGTATTANDYVGTSGTLVFAPGETRKGVPVTVIGDRTVEQNETFTFTLTNPVNGTLGANTAIATIFNDDSITTSDFNQDGINDVVWRNYVTGENQVWLMNSTLPSSVLNLPAVSTNWILEGVGDFNQDGNPDLLWREYGSGGTGIWFMAGGSMLSNLALPTIAPNWQIEGVADFNRDNQPDILWRETNSGAVGIWYMNGSTLSLSTNLTTVGMDWSVDGVADINNDGQTDIIWRYNPTGYTGAWLMYGTATAQFFGSVALPSPNRPDMEVAGSGDFNRDGKTDLIWRNTLTGSNLIWFLDGTRSLTQITTQSMSWPWAGI